jgi:glycosyltransferase involved in cell wall biosynthesis
MPDEARVSPGAWPEPTMRLDAQGRLRHSGGMRDGIRIAAVIPTRNRADLAMEAVHSLVAQQCGIEIFVCDNSNSPDPLSAFCESLRARGVRYVRPPRVLSMPDNWELGLRTALAQSDATHFTVHYDRKVSRPGGWRPLREMCEQWPDDVLTFAADFVTHHPPPLRVWQAPWTGRAFSIDCGHVAELMARGNVGLISHAIPILSNCLIPRQVLERISDTFGSLCNSTGPDSCFMWRFLALAGRYLHLDAPLGIFHAARRGTGMGYVRNKGGDFPDFMKTFGDRPWIDAAPLPGANIGQNLLYHEHALARRVVGDRLPALDMPAVLDDLASSLAWVADRRVKAQLVARLRARGWRGDEPPPVPGWRLRSGVRQQLAWLNLKVRKVEPEDISGFAYLSDRRALKAALKHPRKPQPDAPHLTLLEPRDLRAQPFVTWADMRAPTPAPAHRALFGGG